MSRDNKLNFKHRSYSLQYSQRTLRRQLKRCFRVLVLNFFIILGIIFCILISITIRLKEKEKKSSVSEDQIYEPLISDLDPEGASPHFNENVQFHMPEVKGERKDWHDYAAIAMDRKRIGPGEQGEPVFNTDEGLKHIEEHIALENGFNAFVSDLISVNRSVPDIRDPTCHTKRYLAKLPTVSIVIPCRNEYTSVLQRTLHSIFNRTPKKLLKEIIIVDDNSYRGYTVDDMKEYADLHFPNLVKFVRLFKRRGLTQARVAGAKVATADVLVFFDSHIECNYNWLPPLLEPIAINDRITTSAKIDVISHADFSYHQNADEHGHRGGLNWDLTYLYMPLILSGNADPTKPYKDPVMMGSLFAISRRFFWEVGGYDSGLDIWGSEQFDLSFKIWMCGGMLLVVPCSHVAHIFRGPRNEEPDLERKQDFLFVNNKRVAEVWMDDYKKYLYETNPNIYNNLDPGNLTEQHAVRKRLKCKSFKWFLEFVAPDVLDFNPLDRHMDFANGALQSVARPHLCLDTMQRGENDLVGIYGCAPNLAYPHTNQFWNFNVRQEMKNHFRNLCLDVPGTPPNADVIMFQCHRQGGNQFWYYDEDRKWLIHGSNGKNCLELQEKGQEAKIVVNECNVKNVRMKWLFGFVNHSLVPNSFQTFDE